MPTLIANLSIGKGTWGHVGRLIEDDQWDKVILITNDYGKENFTKNNKTEFIVINASSGLQQLRDVLYTSLKEKIKDSEVAVNFISGSGKEHMVLLAALLKLGVGIRLIALTKEGIKEL